MSWLLSSLSFKRFLLKFLPLSGLIVKEFASCDVTTCTWNKVAKSLFPWKVCFPEVYASIPSCHQSLKLDIKCSIYMPLPMHVILQFKQCNFKHYCAQHTLCLVGLSYQIYSQKVAWKLPSCSICLIEQVLVIGEFPLTKQHANGGWLQYMCILKNRPILTSPVVPQTCHDKHFHGMRSYLFPKNHYRC